MFYKSIFNKFHMMGKCFVTATKSTQYNFWDEAISKALSNEKIRRILRLYCMYIHIYSYTQIIKISCIKNKFFSRKILGVTYVICGLWKALKIISQVFSWISNIQFSIKNNFNKFIAKSNFLPKTVFTTYKWQLW